MCRCWSIPGATEVLSVITVARKLAVKNNCTPHPPSLHLLLGLDPRLPIRLRKTGTSLEVPLAAPCGQTTAWEGEERDQGSKGASGLIPLWPRRFCALSEYSAVPQHKLSAVAAQKDVSTCETHFVATLPKVISLMSSWPWRAIPL